MKKNDLIKTEDGIYRILSIEANRVLAIAIKFKMSLHSILSSSYYIHPPLAADHFSVNASLLTAAVNGSVRNAFIVFNTVL